MKDIDWLLNAILKEPDRAVSRKEAEQIAKAVRMTIMKQPLFTNHDPGSNKINWPTRVFALALQLTHRGAP